MTHSPIATGTQRPFAVQRVKRSCAANGTSRAAKRQAVAAGVAPTATTPTGPCPVHDRSILARVYGTHCLHTLRQYLGSKRVQLGDSSFTPAAVQLLDGVVVASSAAAEPAGVTADAAGDQATLTPPAPTQGMQHIIHECVAIAISRCSSDTEGGSVNVLASGYRRLRYGTTGGLHDYPHIEHKEINTLHNELMKPHWVELVTALQHDDILINAFSNCSVFLPTTNGCYVQATGPPMHVLIWQQLNAAKAAGGTPTRMLTLKQHREKAVEAPQAATPGLTLCIPRPAQIFDEHKLRQIALGRSTMMYVSHRRTEKGLLISNILNTVRSSKRGAEQLLAHILPSICSKRVSKRTSTVPQPKVSDGSKSVTGSSSVPPTAAASYSIPKQYKPLIAHMQHILRKHQTLPYAALLTRCCPLDDKAAKEQAVDALAKLSTASTRSVATCEQPLLRTGEVQKQEELYNTSLSMDADIATACTQLDMPELATVAPDMPPLEVFDSNTQQWRPPLQQLQAPTVATALSQNTRQQPATQLSPQKLNPLSRTAIAGVVKAASTPVVGSTQQAVFQHTKQLKHEYANSRPQPRLADMSLEQLLQHEAPPHSVESFAVNCIIRLLPASLFGKTNLAIIRRNVRGLVRQRRYETMTAHDLMQGFAVNECTLVTKQASVPRNKQQQLHYIAAMLMYWLMNDYVLDLLRSNFYCTDTDVSRNRVCYYRKQVWSYVEKHTVRDMTEDRYSLVPKRSVEQVLLQRSLGFGELRLRPKRNGIRCIQNMAKPATLRAANVTDFKTLAKSPALAGSNTKLIIKNFNLLHSKILRQWQSINQLLRAAFEVLRYEKEVKPSMIGSSVIGYVDVYRKYRHFAIRTRNQPVYAVSVDVKHCFDSVNRDKLFTIMERILQHDSYSLERYATCHQTAGTNRTRTQRCVSPSTDLMLFAEFAQRVCQTLHDTVLVDSVIRQHIPSESLMQLMREHLFANIVKLGESFYVQQAGIPQGSVLSALFCCIYLAHVERVSILPKVAKACMQGCKQPPTVRQPLTRKQDENTNPNVVLSQQHQLPTTPSKQHLSKPSCQRLLLRQMDDFLFLSTCRASAEAFVQQMAQGFEDLGVMVNAEKTQANFNMCIIKTESPTKKNGYKPAATIRIPVVSLLSQTTSDATMSLTATTNNTKQTKSSNATPTSKSEAEQLLAWNGLLIDTRNLNLRVDYSRLIGDDVTDVLTISSSHSPGVTLQRTFNRWLQPKAQPLLLDSTVNTIENVTLNVYDIFRLASAKLMAYHQNSQDGSQRHYQFLLHALCDGVEYFIKMVSARFTYAKAHETRRAASAAKTSQAATPPTYGLNDQQTRIVALSAYVDTMRKHAGSHNSIMQGLVNKLRALQSDDAEVSRTATRRLLEYAVARSMFSSKS